VSIDRADFNEEFADWLKKLIERFLQDALTRIGSKQQEKEWYTPVEASPLLKRKPYTIREWARYKRIKASKRNCGRGNTKEWMISADEIRRIQNEGLLPPNAA
jgi:hypothetical protein